VSDDETTAWLAIALAAEGRPDGWLRLVSAFGGALAAVRAGDEALAAAGARPAAIEKLRESWRDDAPRHMERCRRLGLRIAALGDSAYPALLRQVPDPPLALFWKGCEPSACSPAVAVVGARACSDYGERTARSLGRGLAEAGIVVVSGLARGIDVAAHRGALEGGRTAAVLAGGLDRIYPPEHTGLASNILDRGGCLLTEQPAGRTPRAWLFPFRNRIITGLCQATVVVEARSRSGSLASARHALDQGRDVLAVPGPIDSPLSEGTNRLLRHGAAPFCALTDLAGIPGLRSLDEKNRHKLSKKKVILPDDLSPKEAVIIAFLDHSPATADQICASTALDGTEVLALLTALELDGHVRREGHGLFRATVGNRRPGQFHPY
jgi:DNA processing protein